VNKRDAHSGQETAMRKKHLRREMFLGDVNWEEEEEKEMYGGLEGGEMVKKGRGEVSSKK